MSLQTRHQHLIKVRLSLLRPTQITVGYAEVAQKRAQWSGMDKTERKKFLGSHWFPAVRGPKEDFYIVDHHHLGLALLQEGENEGYVVLVKDLDQLAKNEFWTVMDMHQWVHPYDADGRRQPIAKLPRRLTGMADDPYRSLAGEVRRAGGFPKDSTPFAEFLWADFFRHRIKPKVLRESPDQALRKALVLCHQPAASHLPGWSGIANTAPV